MTRLEALLKEEKELVGYLQAIYQGAKLQGWSRASVQGKLRIVRLRIAEELRKEDVRQEAAES